MTTQMRTNKIIDSELALARKSATIIYMWQTYSEAVAEAENCLVKKGKLQVCLDWRLFE